MTSEVERGEEEREEFSICTSSETPRDLNEDDREKLAKQTEMTDFKKRKLEMEAQKNWDRFYHRNKDNFFKDRNWSHQDITAICGDMQLDRALVYVEAGCGVGNMLFPLCAAFPKWTLQGFDFSQHAVRMLEERAEELGLSVATSIVDLSIPSDATPFSEPADLASLIFVLSAIHPDKQPHVAHNMRKYVKIGGSVLVRDYGVNDHAMVRFGRGSKLGDRFYARQDGTRAYYFTMEELCGLFEAVGFSCAHKEYLHRQTVNHQKGVNVPRVFVQARFVRQR